jgi:GAF domain-containing protein
MRVPALPDNEAERLAALYELLILDTPPEERFNKIVAFAANEFEAPIVLVSLIDEHRQWFKANYGLDAQETGRDISFCGHAILQPDIMVVPDAAADERFANNPLVTGYPNIRFYAGAPLAMPSGHRIGTLCVIDSKPRQFDTVALAIMASLRDLIVQELSGKMEVGDA